MIKLLIFLSLQIIIILTLLYLNRKYLNKKITTNQIAMISAFLFYLSIIVTVIATNYILKNELNSFDLNGDGFFNGKEITTEQQTAMHNVISDTGRNFAPIIGIIYSLIYYLFLLIVLVTIKKSYRFLYKSKNKQDCFNL
ncbi:MAG: hypothetical protein K2X95_05605 [Flavobacteriaceae bacterium]|nr:hypothetical protein [Flavobacteriaceae bacterium]